VTPTGREPLISDVRDNIERDPTMLSFYEIIPGGMAEDALAYVDRVAHQYNGVTAEGLPSCLGADYVKTFNRDKYNRKLKLINSSKDSERSRLEVTLSAPAKLYVLFDNRWPPPRWLTREFRDTGDDIGLDRGPFQSVGKHLHNKGLSAVGQV